MVKINGTKKIVFAGVFFALGIVFPFITMQIPKIGNMLLPMHIPVMLCGFICGAPLGFTVGLLTPLLRSILFGAPVIFPSAVGMMFELAAYGAFCGLLYEAFAKIFKSEYARLYLSMIISMVTGRIIWGAASYMLYSASSTKFTADIFFAQGFINAVPGIIIQLIIVPPIAGRLKKEFLKSEQIKTEENLYKDIQEEINKLLINSDKDTLLVAIDGRCCAGKTTLGNYLKDKYFDCNIFHTDDFFLQPFQRTEERFNETGGNVDYERFKSEVLDKILNKERVLYKPYNCRKQKTESGYFITPKRLNIIEGAYCMHPYFGDCYDLKIFADIEQGEQLKRIENRNGEYMLEKFKDEWIPKEEAYFKEFNIKEQCDLIFIGR